MSTCCHSYTDTANCCPLLTALISCWQHTGCAAWHARLGSSCVRESLGPAAHHHPSCPLSLHPRFRLGRQEDAHEYLRCVLDAMHEAFLKHIKPKPPPELASTTFIHRIFGGKLRSEVGGILLFCHCRHHMLHWPTP